jgi:putative transposase
MKRKRHSEEQIVRILRDAEVSDLSSAEVAKKHGVSEATLFRWKRKYGGMDVSEARRLKELETENARLKKLLAESHLEVEVLKEVAAKKW